MKKLFLTLLLLIIVPLFGLFLFLCYADFNNYKPQIESLALKYANIELKINGDLRLRVSLKPSLELSDVEISNPATNEKIAKIGTALVQISIIPLFEKEIVIDTVQTAKTRIYYGREEYIEINELVADMESLNKPVNLVFDTTISGIKLSGESIVSAINEIKASNYNEISGKAKINSMGCELNFDGKISGLQKDININGEYTVSYKNNKVAGDISADLSSKTPYLKLNVLSDKIDLAEITKPEQVSNIGIISSANASEFVPNMKIPYEYLQYVNADVSVNIKEIDVSNDIVLTNVLGNMNIENSVFKADIKNINAGNGIIRGVVNLNGVSKTAEVKLKGLDIILQNLYLPLSNPQNGEYIKSGGQSNLSIVLSTSGTDTNQYISNMNGQVIAIVYDSIIKIKSLEDLQGNIIVQILNNLKLNITNHDLNMSCAVVRGDIKGGTINFPKGIVLNAKEFYMVADGKVNLNNEKINLDIQPFSGRISDTNISSVLGGLFKIKGTISNPKLAINQTETVKNVVGALASGGVYNASDMMLKVDNSPCHTALKGTIFVNHFEKKGNVVTNTISQSYDDAKTMVRDLGKQAKDFFNGFRKEKK